MNANRFRTASFRSLARWQSWLLATSPLLGRLTMATWQATRLSTGKSRNLRPTPAYRSTAPPSSSGDSLQFTPQAFEAQSGNGINNGLLDFVDGTLNTGVTADMGHVINSITVAEQGDFSLIGAGAYATISAPIILRIDQVNDVALGSPIYTTANLIFTPGSGGPGSYATPVDQGLSKVWTGSISVDIAAVLAANNITGGATSLQWTMDNALTAYAPDGELAFIKKKDIGGVAITVGTGIPEPSSIVLAIVGVAGLLMGVRRQAKSK